MEAFAASVVGVIKKNSVGNIKNENSLEAIKIPKMHFIDVMCYIFQPVLNG